MFLLLTLIGPIIAIFTETTHKLSISEDALPGSLIGRLPLQSGIDYRPSGLPPELRLEEDKLYLSIALDREQTPSLHFSLVSSLPPAIIHIVVTVEDVNDNSPSFPLAFQNLSVLETATRGSRLPLVAAVDPDEGKNGRIQNYELFPADGVFNLVEEDGNIFLELEEPLDREHKQLYSYNLTARDGGAPSRLGWTAIYVQVLDVNDCAPVFEERRIVVTYNGKKSEPITVFNAVDGDEGKNALIHYEILGGGSDFEIWENKLYSKVDSPSCQDLSLCGECLLTVQATDSGNPPLSTTAEVVIKCQGENQHDPEIQIRLQPSHVDFAVISPTSEVGKAVAVLTATDEDGPFGESGYLKILNDEGLFQLQPQQGFWILRLARSGAEFTQPEYQVVFEVSDGQGTARTSKKSLTVYTEGKQDHSKKIAVQLMAKILENAPKGSLVTQIGGNSTGQRFKLANETGTLPVEVDEINGIVTTTMDSLTPGRLFFDISVFPPPPAIQPYLVTVELLIEDINNHSPEIKAPTTVEIPEDTAPGRGILTFDVHDQDLGNNGKTFTSLIEGGEYVRLEKNTVILRKSLDFEKEKQFEVILETIDQGKPPLSSRKTIVFNILDSNDRAPFFPCQERHFSISSFLPIGAEIGRIQAEDQDSLELTQLSYSLLDPTQLFSLGPTTGIISTAKKLEARTYKLGIRAQDQGGLVSSNNLTVFIHSSALPLPYITSNLEKISLEEGQPQRIVSKLEGNGTFASPSPWITVDPDGTIKLAHLPPEDTFWALIRLESGGLTTSKCLEFEKIPIPPAPKFKKSRLEMNITSNLPLGTQLERIQACETCFYSTDCPFLSVDGKGILTLSRLFQTDKMVCSVTARDNKDRMDKMDIIIRREPENENFRLPANFEFFISPDLPLGAIIGRLPSSQNHIYSLKDSKAIGIFPDGVLYVKRQLKPLEVYSFIVEAAHKRLGNRHSTEIWIRVEDTTRKELKCPEEKVLIEENNPAGATVGLLNYDPSIKIRQLDALDQIFISPIGRIQVLNSLDAEKVSNITVRIELSQGKEKKTCLLVVEVQDQNEFPPEFEQLFYKATVPFGPTETGILGTVKAVDKDRTGSPMVYRLMSHREFFQINSTSGELSIISSLPSDSVLNVSIRATDQGASPLHSHTFFLISTGQNPDLPVIFLDNSTIRISPSATVGSVFGRVAASSESQRILRVSSEDPRFSVDSYGFIRLLAKPTTLSKAFEVEFVTQGAVQRRKMVVSDFIPVPENRPNFTLQSVSPSSKIALISPPSLSFSLNGGNLQATHLDREIVDKYQILLENQGVYSLVDVEVEDEKDSPPHCGSNTFLIEEVPTTVELNCWDRDLNSTIYYSMTKKIEGIMVRPDGMVKIERLEDIVTRVEVDVADRDSAPILTTVTFIKSKEDPSITFPADSFNLLLSSSLKIGQSFGKVAAEADSHLEYYLLGSDTFTVDKETGELSLIQKSDILLNPEPKEVTLIAANRLGIASVKIRIEIVEDSLYLLRSSFILEAKNRIVGSLIGQIDIGRKDLTLEVRDDRFFIKENQLFIKKSLENVTVSLIPVDIEVTKGRISSKITAYIILPPPASHLDFKLPENLPKGWIVGEVPYGYTEMEGNAPLRISGDGILRTTEILDREKMAFYNFTLKNGAGQSLQALLTVEDENDNPPTLESSKFKVQTPEDVDIGAALLRIHFNDSDSSNFFHFSIEEGNELEQFEIDQWGLVKVKRSLDYEKQKSHRLKVVLTDGVAPFQFHTVSCEVLITVLDMNDSPPVLTSPRSFTIQENSPLGTTMGSIVATDPDSSNLLYRIVPESLPLAEFALDPIFGYLTVNKELDYERRQNYSFLVEISYGELISEERIDVVILDQNDNPPRFLEMEREFTIKETSPIGYTITRLEVRDLDSEDNARCFFWLTSNSTAFKIGENSGLLYVSGRLDYEKQREYNLTVHAKNIAPGTAIISRNLTVILEDENDESPRFLKGSPQTLEVYENLLGPFPLVISNSVSEDEDAGDTVAYSLLSGNSSLFGVDTKSGDILLLNSLDREEQERHELTILASDSGRPRRSSLAEVTIQVLDENDHSPRFLQPYYRAKIMENSENGTEVLQLLAEDQDLGVNSEISYRILEKSVPFWINPQTGKIIVMGKIDREEKEQWQITVEARDNGRFGRLYSTVPVRITITNVNDNPPIIRNTQMDIFIDGKTKKGETFHVVDIYEPDDDPLTLTLSGPDSSNFEALQDGQLVSLMDSLLMKSFYTITVTVEDPAGKSTSATFTFYVDDAIFPTFSPLGTVRIPENTLQIVANFRATTLKSSPADQIQYTLLAGNDGSFAVGPLNGVLSLLKPLDREKKNFYRVWVRATDSDTPSKSSIQSVEIHVLDQNDKNPEFSQVVYNATVKENSDPQDLLTISASDDDLGANAAISYKITDGNEDDLFSIGENGVIRSLAPLNREEAAVHRFTVTATDSGSPALSQEALVVITVEDEDDNSPKFTRLFHAEIAEDMPVGSEVVLVSATDIDGSNSHNFSLEEADNTFTINRTSGCITMAKLLDREQTSSYRLRVRLEDGVWTIFTSVQITVMDVNDNYPVFERQSYVVTAEKPGKVRAIDLDEGNNGAVLYSLLEDNPYASISPKSGEINIIGRSPRTVEKITVMARDSGTPCRSAAVPLWVLFNFVQLPPLTMSFSKMARIGDAIWKFDRIKAKYLLSSPYFNLTNGTVSITNPAKDFPPGPSPDLGTLTTIQEGSITHQSLSIKLLETDSPAPKFLSKTTRLLVPEETPIGTYLGQLELKGDGWKRITVQGDSNLVIITEKGGVILKEELEKKQYNLTVVVEDLLERKDSTQLILEVNFSPNQKKFLENRVHPLLYLGSAPLCLPSWIMDHFDTVEEALLDEGNCLLFNGTVPHKLTLISNEEEDVNLSIPIFNTLGLGQKIPGMQTSMIQNPERIWIGTKLRKIVEKDENCTAVQETSYLGYCITKDYLEVCQPIKLSQSSNLIVIKLICPDSMKFLDLTLLPPKESRLNPTIITLRENQPAQRIANLILEGEEDSRLQIVDQEAKKLFSISETNELRSLVAFDREERSFYSIPLISSRGGNHTVQLLIDDVLDSPSLSNQNLSVVLFGQLKNPVRGGIRPASLGTVHQSTCAVVENQEYQVSSDCFLTLNRFPEGLITFSSMENNLTSSYGVSFSYKRLRLLRLDSALFLSLFGPPDGIAAFFSGLHTNFPDLKFYPSAISTKERYYHTLTMGIADRHDKIVTVKEGQKVIDSFLTSQPVLEQLEEEKPACGNYSVRIMTTGRHLPFRGVDTLWLLPEGRVEMSCMHEQDRLEAVETSKHQTKPESCSKKTCPEGICSIENGKVVCLKGEEDNVCGDRSAISFTDGHLELRPTSFFHHLLLQKTPDCNDSSISFDFKTKSDGSLLSLENRNGFRSSLEIVKGLPTYRLSDAYRSPVEIPLTRVVSDGEWHTLSFKMMDNGRRILLEIDGVGREARTKTHLPLPLTDDLKIVQIGGNTRFIGCIRHVSFNDHALPLHGSQNPQELFSISAVGHISWSNGSSSPLRLSPSSVMIIAAILALAAVVCLVYCISKFYFKWKDRKEPAWQETRDIDAIRVRHGPKNSPMSSSTETHIYDVADRVRKPQETELSSFERAPTLPVRKIRTVADVTLQIPRTSTPKSFYRNDGYV